MAVGVVLSGGGPLAVAWECGVAGGLGSRGFVLGGADRILGTSAGAMVGAQLAAGRDPQAMAQAIIDEKGRAPPPGTMTPYPQEAAARLPEMFAKAQSGNAGRAEVGAYALQAATSEPEAAYIAGVEASLGLDVWPKRGLGIVAVDAMSGAVVIFSRETKATLGQAIAASCSLPGLSPPVSVGERRYLDGGLRSVSNLDLLGSCETVIVLCFRPPGPVGDRMLARTHSQAEVLAAKGVRVRIIPPDDACLAAIGPHTLDILRRPDVAYAGTLQGASLADDLLRFSGPLAD